MFLFPQPVKEFGSYIVEERPGERWILLRRKFGGNEDIKIEATMFDGSGPGKNSGEDIQLHITLILSISKDAGESFLEFVCSAWPDSVEIEKVYMRGHDQMHAQTYMGPKFEYVFAIPSRLSVCLWKNEAQKKI